MKRIFVLEDITTSEIVKFLENNGYSVTFAETLDDTVYCLEDDPGLEELDKLLFDLDVPECTTEHERGEPRVSIYKGKYAGLEYIKDNYRHWPEFQQYVDKRRVAILTAHAGAMQGDFDQLLKESDGLDKVEIIFKLSSTMDELLLKFLSRK
jgi:CheY-like chemotaxis protein